MSDTGVSRLECGVCYTKYNENDRKPKSLPCGHTFCNICVEKMYKSGEGIRCPLDQKRFRVEDISKIPINYAFLEMIQDEIKENS